MPAPQSQDLSFTVKFGGGINSAASEDDILVNEASSGGNYVLDYKNRNLTPRPAINKLGTAPNGSPIKGFVTLTNSDGESSLLVQAGAAVYRWDSVSGFTNIGSCHVDSQLRGHSHHYWPLDDVVIVTDLAEKTPVKIWDGSTLTTMTHNLTGDFYAKYCWIDNERAYFANVKSNSTPTPHMVVVSKLSDYQNLSISDRPSSSLGADDPCYMLSPDLRPINGMLGYYSGIAVSTERGSIFNISGSDSSDFSISQFYPKSYATGKESLASSGNDILIGRLGRIESLVSTQNYGDVATDDLTIPIKNQIVSLQNWMFAYNSRTQKVYSYAAGETTLWQFSKDVANSEFSPWVPITTNNYFNMLITSMMSIIDPIDNLEYIFFGDTYGNIYKIEGAVGEHDCGENDITTSWRSGILKLGQGYNAYGVQGYISYRAESDVDITLRVIFGGSNSSVDITNMTLEGASGGSYFGGSYYFGGSSYFGAQFSGSFKREGIFPAGTSEEIQIEIIREGTSFFEINEIGIRFTGKTMP